MLSYFKGWYNGIFAEIPQGESTDECFFVCHVEMRKCAQLMEIRSHCCLTVGTFAVIACVINLWDERLQPLMVTHCIKELLLWMTLRANEYEYIYKNRHGLPSQCRLGVTVTLVGHGWWEMEPLPLEMLQGSDKQPTHIHTHAHTITHRRIPQHDDIQKRLQHLRMTISSSYDSLYSLDINNLIYQSLCLLHCYVPEIIIIPVSIIANCSICAWCHSKQIIYYYVKNIEQVGDLKEDFSHFWKSTGVILLASDLCCINNTFTLPVNQFIDLSCGNKVM